jgi:hypothetical protein
VLRNNAIRGITSLVLNSKPVPENARVDAESPDHLVKSNLEAVKGEPAN